jgi:pimeloyl-ACP methyl ester carboxylesterase
MPSSQVGGVRLYYEDHPGENQVPLVFIHGFSLTGIIDIDNNPHKVWIPQIEHFKDRRRIIVFDLRGFGQSDKPREKYSIKTFSEDLFSLLKNLQVEKATIVGYSMGGMVALRFVLDHQETVNKLILISTTASMQFPYWKRRVFAPLWTRVQMRKLPADLTTPRYIFPSCWSTIANFNVVSELPRIQVQTLIIHAEGETFFTLNQAKCMKDHLPNAKLVVLEGVETHLHPISTPQRTWKAIEEFISD